MPKRTDLHSILIIGAGPIVIGQACEFDYSGAQACKALREEGYRIILVNSNPATIMTDPELADATYIEPLTPDVLEKIILKEKPSAVLPTMGGQTALNLGLELAKTGILEKHGVELIGAQEDVIEKAENRELFRNAMDKIGLESARSMLVTRLEQADEALELVDLPVILRPSFTLGGQGGGIAYNKKDYLALLAQGLLLSPTSEVLVEESILGWKEFEMEVVRDQADNCIIICSIENIDPMGVHTGDSVTVAPALTLTDKEYQRMRNASLAVLREIGVNTGGSNVQFAVNPEDGRLIVIEMNPRVSRSSALASKATGFPIAKIAAKLAVGYTLDELKNDITETTPASFEPSIDYVVTKIPRFTFEKFPGAKPLLGTAMKSVGEAMAIGRSFQESLQKALCSMETGLTGLNDLLTTELDGQDPQRQAKTVLAELSTLRPDRLLLIAQAYRLGCTEEQIHTACQYDPWFLKQIKELVDAEQALLEHPTILENKDLLFSYKKKGFSDARLAELVNKEEADISKLRHSLGVVPVYKRIDSCAAEMNSVTSYMYSCYETPYFKLNEQNTLTTHTANEANPSAKEKIMILGGGPNRIGQGIEFDYCCCHAAYALREAGYETIMVNCNPETVSTDYDTSDRLYFEPLTSESVIAIARQEQEKGTLLGVIVQYGGQTPLKLASDLEKAQIPILGTAPDAIDLAEDRERFQKLLHDLKLKQPHNGLATSVEQAVTIAKEIGYPVLLRPSYVLGGRAMEIVHDEQSLHHYMKTAVQASGRNPVLIDSYLGRAIEVDVDVIADGTDSFVAGIMEHIEEAGVHSGDSACSLPPYSLSSEIIAQLTQQAKQLATALNIKGLMNIQFAISDNEIFVLEVNPRASRTVPFVAKATHNPIAKIGARLMAGEKLSSFTLLPLQDNFCAVKEAVFPFARFPGVDVLLGPEMRSTGEVMGIDEDFPRAFLKAQIGAFNPLPTPEEGKIFLSICDREKEVCLDIAQTFQDLGFKLIVTEGTAALLNDANITAEKTNKVHQAHPNIEDEIKNEEISMMINITDGRRSRHDSLELRRLALSQKIPYFTTLTAARAAALSLKARHEQRGLEVAPLQSYLI